MKVLITGAAGFLGYHLTHYLLDKNYEVVGLDIAEFPEGDYPSEMKKYKVDVRDRQGVEKILIEEKPDMIVHAAAALPLWSRRDIFTTNVEGTRNILDAAYKHSVQRVVYISSTAVYGIPKIHPLYENSPLVGVGSYGESKILAEKECQKYRDKGLIVSIVRPKTFIGTERLGVFEILFDWIKDGKKIPVIGRGNNKYQLLEVDDLCNAIYLCLTGAEGKVNQVFNVGAKDFTTVREDLNALLAFSHSGSKVMATPAKLVKFFLAIFSLLHLSPLYEWVYGTADTDSFVSVDKIEKELNWHPQHSNKDALIRAYQWYLDNYKEVRKLGSGVTHRRAWKQGVLALVKKFM